ncbi:MAG TPA: hypothetical protein VFA33_14695 [Bryobacteraceae bacterium]|nr:hypothetical protein [Bryobacteraceae bacterium]
MPNCANCGERMQRVHRSFREKFLFLALYECGQCQSRRPEPRRTTFYLGEYPRCPRCGTYRLRQMPVRDQIDPMRRGLFNRLQGWLGGTLYHCRYCRVQFYDLRKTILPEAHKTVTAASVSQPGSPAPASAIRPVGPCE